MASQNNESYQDLGSLKNFQVNLLNTDRTKSIDITLQVLSLVIYEDIFAPSLYGAVHIDDSIGLMNGIPGGNQTNVYFPIVGEEHLDIIYEVSGRPSVSASFAIYGIESIENSDNFKNRKYLLKFASQEHIKDATTLIQKAYKSQVSDMASDIFKTYLGTNKTVDIQATRGQQSVVIPNLTPFETLDFLANRSLDANKLSSASFICFENLDGFHFTDIENLIKNSTQKKQAAEAKEDTKNYYKYFIKNPLINEAQENAFKTAMSFSIINRFDTIEKLKRGYFESSTIVYDFVNHAFINNRFKFKDTNSSTISVAKYPENSTTFIGNATSPSGNTVNKSLTSTKDVYVKQFFVAKDATLPDTFFELIIGPRASYMTRLSQNMTSIETYGDPIIRAGDIITLDYPEIVGTTGPVAKDKFLSGDFLIGTIQHRFTKNAYVTKLDLYKNGYESEVVESENRGNTDIKSIVSNRDTLINQQEADFAITNVVNIGGVKIFK